MTEKTATTLWQEITKEVIKSCVLALILGYAACIFSNIQANNKAVDNFNQITTELKYRLIFTRYILAQSEVFKKGGIKKFTGAIMMCELVRYGFEDSSIMGLSVRLSGMTRSDLFSQFHSELFSYLTTIQVLMAENHEFATDFESEKGYIKTLDLAIDKLEIIIKYGPKVKSIYNPL